MTLDVSAALPRLAQRLGGEGARLSEAGRLSGGASMETWAFAIEGAKGREDLILRRRSVPFDPQNARSISLATEAALIRATGARGAPVPIVRHVCDEADGLGEAYVMGRVDGETLGRKIVSDPRFDAVRGKLAHQCGEVLAQIHATPPPAGLTLKTVDGLGELDRYQEVYRTVGAERPILELAFQYLRRHTPDPVAPRVALASSITVVTLICGTPDRMIQRSKKRSSESALSASNALRTSSVPTFLKRDS